MVPMRARRRMRALHEPTCSAGFPACGFTGLSSPVDQERATGKSPEPPGSKACATNPPRFMVPMRDKYAVGATHEPERRPPARPVLGAYYPARAESSVGERRADSK